MSRSIKETASLFHHLLLVFQYRNRFLANAYGHSVSIHEMHLLVELDTKTKIFSKDLIALELGPQSLVSRRLKALVQQGYVKSIQSKQDARSHQLKLTATGKSILSKLDKVANSLSLAFGRNLSATELKKLKDLLNCLFEAAGVPAGVIRKQDQGLRPEFRRLARFMGVIFPSFMGSELSSAEWQLLQAIRYSFKLMSVSELAECFQLEQSTVSKALARFKSARYIKEVPDAQDSRVKRLIILNAGVKKLNAIDKAAIAKLTSPLSSFSKAQQKLLIELLSCYVFGSLDQVCKSFNECSLSQAKALRRSYLSDLIADVESDLPYEILHPDNLIIASKDPELQAFIEIKTEARCCRVINFYYNSGSIENYLDRLFFLVSSLRVAADILGVKDFVTSNNYSLAFIELEKLFGIRLLED